MSKNVICIHGMWSKPSVWDAFKQRMEAEAYTVHTPALPYHESMEAQQGVDMGQVSLAEYIDAMTDFVAEFEEPPILVGHSMGGMIAQGVAARLPLHQLILLNPAAPAGVFAFRFSVIRLFVRHLLQWQFWAKPIRLSWEEARWGIFNGVDKAQAKAHYEDQVVESGRAAAEIAFWLFDRHKTSKVDFDKVTCPVLVVGAEHDRIVPSSVCSVVARRYADSLFHEIKGSGHWTLEGSPLDKIIQLSLKELSRPVEKT